MKKRFFAISDKPTCSKQGEDKKKFNAKRKREKKKSSDRLKVKRTRPAW